MGSAVGGGVGAGSVAAGGVTAGGRGEYATGDGETGLLIGVAPGVVAGELLMGEEGGRGLLMGLEGGGGLLGPGTVPFSTTRGFVGKGTGRTGEAVAAGLVTPGDGAAPVTAGVMVGVTAGVTIGVTAGVATGETGAGGGEAST